MGHRAVRGEQREQREQIQVGCVGNGTDFVLLAARLLQFSGRPGYVGVHRTAVVVWSGQELEISTTALHILRVHAAVPSLVFAIAVYGA
mmetsp:Transcript_5966/g.9457  ORF Transcript_5966/g.9457 Transcript_5966/m.9457 type:complete len:89 (-) Transcript_5966:162-428(-)